MATQTPNPGSQPPAKKTPRADERELPKTGRDASEPLEEEEEAEEDLPTDDDDLDDDDETGQIELPGQGNEADRRDNAGNR